MNACHLYKQWLKGFSAMCNASMTALHMINDDGSQLLSRAARESPDLWRDWTQEIPWPMSIGAGVCGEAVVFGQVAVTLSLEDYKFGGVREVARAVGIGAMWAVPILCDNDQVLGTVAAFHTDAVKA